MSSDKAGHVHFLGICGYAVSGAALLAQQLGYRVTGSDEHAYPPTTEVLTAAGITWVDHHDPANLDRFGTPDLVVVGNQIRPDNPEWGAVQRRGLPYTSEAEFYAELTRDRYRIAVCGTHGKTTTAALLALMLERAGLDPGFRLGAPSRDFGVSARLGSGPFVIEGDEYTTAPWDRRPKFLHARPHAACVTVLEHDHPDVYPTLADYRQPFVALAQSMPADGLLVLGGGEGGGRELAGWARCRVEIYGEEADADWRITDVGADSGAAQRFIVVHDGEHLDVVLSQPGAHNRGNAVAALALARHAGAPLEACLTACRDFLGAARRFQVLAEVGSVVVVDDYGHHPTEVAATIAAARQRYPGRRVIVVNVPHTYSRTKELLEAYRLAYAGAARVIVGPIEAARERHLVATVSSDDVAARARAGGVDAVVVPDAAAAVAAVLDVVRPGDVVLCISLGGFDKVAQRLVEALPRRPPTTT